MKRRLDEVGMKALAALALIAALGHASALACECVGPRLPYSICAERSDAVFSGVAVVVRDSVQEIDEDTGVVFRVAWIRVEKAWKGVRADTVVTVVTGSGHGDCGFSFAPGQRYVVFAKGPSRGTNRCGCTSGVVAPWGPIDSLGTPVSRAKVVEPRTASH